MKIFKKKNSGFSLVELMIVVAIIGVLSALAVPRFQAFQAKAKATEARTSMAAIYTLQNAYHGDNDTYGTLAQIGFSLNGQAATTTLNANPGAKIRFTYTLPQFGQQTFTASVSAAAGILGGCQSAAHTGTINHNNAIVLASTIPGC